MIKSLCLEGREDKVKTQYLRNSVFYPQIQFILWWCMVEKRSYISPFNKGIQDSRVKLHMDEH